MDPEAEKQIVEKYYKRAVAGTRSDVEELAIAEKLLEGALKGDVPTDDGTKLYTITDVDLPVDAEFLLRENPPHGKLRELLPAIAAVTIGLILVLFVFGGGKEETTPTPTTTAVSVALATQTLTPIPVTPSGTPSPTVTPRPTDTPLPSSTPLPTMTATPAPPKEVEVKPEPVELEPEAVIPVSIEVAGRYFPVVPTTLRDNTWAYVTEPDRVSWLAGSAVNVILGLPYDEDNQDLLAAEVTISGTLTVRNSVGGTQIYQVTDRHQVSVYETETLGQQKVGLTLLLLGGNEEDPDRRLAIQARPLDEEEVSIEQN